MGRHSTAPAALPRTDGERLLGGYYVTRVVDPDDEFAQHQWLAYSQSFQFDESYVWSDTLSDRVVLFARRWDAEGVVRAYRLGYEDASDRVRVSPLGS